MRDLKIRTKLMLGFGSVILLIMIVAAFVIYTSVNSINNVSIIDQDSNLQTQANNMRANYINARVPANILSYTVNPQIHEDFKALASAVTEDFKSIYAYIDANSELNKFKSDLQKAETAMNEWIELANLLGKYNEQEVISEAKLNETAKLVAPTSDALINDQLALLERSIDAGASMTELTRISENIIKANEITSKISSFRVSARVITATYDASTMPTVIASMDIVITELYELKDLCRLQAQKDMVQNLIDVVTDYEQALTDFGEICNAADETAVKRTNKNAEVQTLVAQALNAIDEAMERRVETTNNSASTTLIIVIVVVCAALLVAFFMAYIILRSITKPLHAMYDVIDKVGRTGSLKISAAEKSELNAAVSKDEIGESIAAFTKLFDHLVELSESLEIIASGDMSVHVHTVSAEDTMGTALIKMLDNLNDMFRNINEASDQVNSGASQVSVASQSLAQGATEQASSVEELSASIQEISSQVNENSENADNAAVIANETTEEVNIGNSQMQQMLEAMNDINTSSNEISKIIKVIDDIAFQTNILALNAAVEAARAGEAGKGFAVVADEVRNLASKSADAAKQTTGLIEGSIQNVARGAEIAQKTARSLELVEQKTKEVNRLITEIASASKEQAQGVSQINIGVEQISSVIQTNSATAEESAAAAEELSSQSNILSEQVSYFKLK